jgi:hypothetical protein
MPDPGASFRFPSFDLVLPMSFAESACQVTNPGKKPACYPITTWQSGHAKSESYQNED